MEGDSAATTSSSDQYLSPASASDAEHRKSNSTSSAPPTIEPRSSRLSLPNLNYRSRSPSPAPKTSTLGLHIVHRPVADAPVDIIFVHGLGGDSRATWSKNHDPELFWPGHWLPSDPVIGKARILTFGYDASFRVGAPRSISNISDFAKRLLHGMEFGKDEDGEDLGIGTVPIIFVAHSMGGLVVKNAYLFGQHDSQYEHIVRSISAIVFLATPHRGTNLAEVLNRVLIASFQSPKGFIADLKQSSPAIAGLNEQFRHIAPLLKIFSFYETHPTTIFTIIKPKQIMVLEKESAILGYGNDVSMGLDADHHEVCKYFSPTDPNYVSVRDTLRTLVGQLGLKTIRPSNPTSRNAGNNLGLDSAKDIETLLAISISPEDDFNTFRHLWMPGTCDWIFSQPSIQSWLSESPETRVLWFNAPPASGKSVLSTHIISHLRDSGMNCQYFYFKFDDQSKRSLSTMLRSIAYQIARESSDFKRRLLERSAEEIGLDKADSTLVWQRIFESILFELDFGYPLYWVIDALDESDSPKALVDLLRALPKSRTTLRVLIISRKTEPLSLAFNRISGLMLIDFVEMDGHDHISSDIRKLVEKEIKHMRGSEALKQRVAQSIIIRAGGNFLWVRLVLDELLHCHTEESIQETLDEIPNDMNKLYQRMELAILNNPRKSDRRLAKSLFQWTICAQRCLTLKELSQALRPEFPEFLDLRRTIQDVCGQFILVDHREHVRMVHQTARDYLITTSNSETSINLRLAHEKLFMKTASTLLGSKLRFTLTQTQDALLRTDPFVYYVALSWTYHLRHSHTTSDEALDVLVKLFRSTSVLTWIQTLAIVGRLEILVKAAKAVTAFVKANRKLNAAKNPLLHRLSDLELLEYWAIDLVKVVGRFSKHLLLDPSAIYKLVPALCPEKSILHRQFYRPESAELLISGISNSDWSDNLAKIILPGGDQAWEIACAGHQIAILGSAGTISVWDSDNFTEVCTLGHHEPVTAICFNSKGNKFVTYGLRSTKLWSIPSGQLLASTSNPAHSKAMAIVFAENDAKILTGSDDKMIRYLHSGDFKSGWHVLNDALLREIPQIEGTVVNSPMCIAFNGDATQVGVSYRGFPLSVWELNEARCIGRCRRAKQLRNDQGRPSTSWFAVDRFIWNPVSGHIIGIYKDGCIFKWHPVTDENQEVQSAADEVAASSDGKLFITSDSNGTVRVWNFAYFSVIYQLSSADLVSGLIFSPNCQRFYDLRGACVNAWEPSSLLRLIETEESFSDTASEDQAPTSVSQASEAMALQYEAVSALAVAQNSRLYCFGNEEGIVNLLDARTGESIELAKFLNFLSVSHVAWGDDARHIAAADLAGDIVVKRLVFSGHSGSSSNIEVKSMPGPTVNLEGHGIQQLLFSCDSKSLLITSELQCQILVVEDGTVRASATFENSTSRKWLQHPTQPQWFLGFGPNDVKVFQWQDFAEQSCLLLGEDRSRLNSEASFDGKNEQTLGMTQLSLNDKAGQGLTDTVSKVILTKDCKHVLVQIKQTSALGKFTKRLLIFDSFAFDISDKQKFIPPLTSIYIPPDLMARIEIPLDIRSGSRLFFLDQDLWICSLRLGSMFDDEALKRHYFIPRDWASTETLELCCMMKDGTFLCPKQDSVAVIRNNLDSASF